MRTPTAKDEDTRTLGGTNYDSLAIIAQVQDSGFI